jgi:hypothetical protein
MAASGPPPPARVPALIIVAHAAAVYLFFLAVLGYAVGFFAGLAVPKGIDQGPRAEVITPADPGYDGAPRSWSRPC